MNFDDAYRNLLNWSKEIYLLDGIIGLLEWDQRCFIPDKGHDGRSEQIAYITKIKHEMLRNPKVAEWLAIVSLYDNDPDIEANVREWKRWYDRASKVPVDLAESIAKLTSQAETVWAKAKKDNDWESFKPYLSEIFHLKKEEAEAVGYENSPYDALFDNFEPNATVSEFLPFVEELKGKLQNVLSRVLSTENVDDSFLYRKFPVQIQDRFFRTIARKIGYNFSAGRLDETVHPFTVAIGPADVRIAVRLSDHDIRVGLFSTIHEVGHALYDQGLDPEKVATPLGMPVSLGIHESQSRFWENIVGRSKGFWVYFYPRLLQHFPILADISLDSFWRGVNKIEPSLIRTEADELTYIFHIILRFEIELGLLEGALTIEDVPYAWNAKMKDYLNIEPSDYSSGVLQDVHWSSGLVGYFPTYLLGSIYAAQLKNALEKELGPIDELCSKGQFFSILEWLRYKIHRKGCKHLPADLIKEATGFPPSAGFFVEYMEDKVNRVYGV